VRIMLSDTKVAAQARRLSTVKIAAWKSMEALNSLKFHMH